MFRLLLLVAVLAAAQAAPVESDTEFCAGETECPADCGFVARNEKCVFCQCGPGPLKPGEVVVAAELPCPPGTVLGKRLAFTKTCVPAPTPTVPGEGCPHGQSFIDECNNDCNCVDNKFYGCTRKACKPGQTAEKPMTCTGTDDLPERTGKRVFCHEGIVKVQSKDAACIPGAIFKEECNDCQCSDNGQAGCTLKFCLPEEKVESDTEFCAGETECPADCGFVARNEKCVFCQCGPGPLKPGEVVVAAELPCPPGTVLGKRLAFTKTCVPAPTPTVPGEGCPHGQSFIDECDNDCTCVDNKFYGCTRKACKPGQTAEKPMTCTGTDDLPERTGKRVFCHEGIVKVQSKDAACLPGATFKEECNNCQCGDDGQAGCTLKFCLPEEKGEGCPHGQSFIDECDNDCSCVNNEFYGCTRKACKPGQTAEKPMTCTGTDNLPERTGKRVFCHEDIVKVQSKDATCLPGATFKEECNTCRCGDDGQAGCTLKFCLPEEKDDIGIPGCPHGKAFIDECNNDCNCVDNKFYGCTRKACKPGETPEKPMTCTGLENLPERTGKRVFCHEGIVKFQSKDATCLPGATFKEECNTCRCGDDGQAGCTLKLCLPEDRDDTETPGCPHGKAFIDECNNDCNCVDNKFYGCTRKACKPGQTAEKPMTCTGTDNLPERTKTRVFCHEGIVKFQSKDATCLPGATFKEECNTCRCGDDGQAGCTLKLCLPEDKGCPHGKQFIDECNNDCNCVDNKFYGCTRKACKPGQTAEKPMTCTGTDDLPERTGKRVFCHEDIVKVQSKDDACLPGAVFKQDCNTCRCSNTGVAGCTLKFCL